MTKYSTLFAIMLFVFCVNAQNNATATTELMELAKSTLKAHGGEKLTAVKTMVQRGSLEINAAVAPVPLPGSFALVISGDKYRFDIEGFGFNFQQIYDGVNTSSSMPGITIPPITLVGLNILPQIEKEGFTVSALPEKLKKKKGFRVTSPEGYYSDFIVDEKNFQVKEYESAYEYNGNLVSTSVSINKYKNIEGVLVTEKYEQRLDLGSITAYIKFNAKDISINAEVTDDVFSLRK